MWLNMHGTNVPYAERYMVLDSPLNTLLLQVFRSRNGTLPTINSVISENHSDILETSKPV